MCEICRSSPCNSRCPNVSEPKIIGNCEQCSGSIRSDYTYYCDYENNMFCCEECAVKYYGIEETEWNDG